MSQPRPSSLWLGFARHVRSAIVVSVAAVLAACGADSGGNPTTLTPGSLPITGPAWYVSAAGSADGDGSQSKPFNSLQDLEAASQDGDTLVVLPAPLDLPPLDGGIALKPGQRLIGAGPSVLLQGPNAAVSGVRELPALPRIRNSSTLRLNGDAVHLAPGAQVRNLVITESQRGAIYGLNVPGVRIEGNDVSGYNRLCVIGFTVEPFTAPTLLPYFGVPTVLPAGWAGIMVDADGGAGDIAILNNYVHDSACGNGIDLRINGDADYRAEVSGNFITALQLGPLHQTEELHLVHAITTQVSDQARLDVYSIDNTQTRIGSVGADCEGLFMNLSDSASGRWIIDRNLYQHGIGGFSCNGMELIISNGNAVGEMQISNSHFEDNPGDMFQQINLGSGSTLRLQIDTVVIKDTIQRGGDPDSNGLPFNLGECLLMGSTGSGNTTVLSIANSDFSGCNNGLSILNGVNITTNLLGAVTTGQLPGNPIAPDALIEVDISNSRITDNAFSNLLVGILTNLDRLDLKVENTDLRRAGSNAVALRKVFGGEVADARIDFGGGALDSRGGNCVLGGAEFDVLSEGFDATMQRNWWGQPGGPQSGAIAQDAPDAIDPTKPLAAAPALCLE